MKPYVYSCLNVCLTCCMSNFPKSLKTGPKHHCMKEEKRKFNIVEQIFRTKA